MPVFADGQTPRPACMRACRGCLQECLGDASAGIKPKRRCLLAFLPDLLDSKAAGGGGGQQHA